MANLANLGNAAIFFLAGGVLILAATAMYELITKYKVWEQIWKGNKAAALSLGGIVIGVANIMKSAIASNDSLLDTVSWGGIGIVALLAVYFLFELLTPKLNVNDELENGNVGVGIISFGFSIAFSLIISACIV